MEAPGSFAARVDPVPYKGLLEDLRELKALQAEMNRHPPYVPQLVAHPLPPPRSQLDELVCGPQPIVYSLTSPARQEEEGPSAAAREPRTYRLSELHNLMKMWMDDSPTRNMTPGQLVQRFGEGDHYLYIDRDVCHALLEFWTHQRKIQRLDNSNVG